MEGIITFVLTMAIYLWLCSLGGKNSSGNGNSNDQSFGDGNNRYDFKDYVNNKVDKDVK